MDATVNTAIITTTVAWVRMKVITTTKLSQSQLGKVKVSVTADPHTNG